MEKEFIQIIKENQKIILKICNVYCQDTADREDLFQDILIQLWKAYPRFDQRAKLSTWIYRIAFNTAVSRYRKVERRLKTEELKDTFVVSEVSHDQREALDHAIRSLNAIDRAIISLYLDEVKYKEIGEIMGLSESNVGFKLNQIKKKLKEQIELIK